VGKRKIGGGILLVVAFLAARQADAQTASPLVTVAEKTDYRATSRHEEVVDFCRRLAKESPVVRLAELGKSFEGRELPLMILADPPVATPDEAAKSGKLVVFALGNIHAGEVDGKEALLMLARDIATGKDRSLLKNLVIVIAPIFNADGNEKLARTHRPQQAGPEEVGQRANAQGLDLNRDFVKLETPEVRALVRFLNRWDPAVFIDMHTTNGSHHRYTITYEGPRHPACNPKLVALVNDDLLPDVTRRLEARSGYKSYFYGNFSRDRGRWETVPATPRYGIHYVALRNRISILSESYAYASYRDRVCASRDFMHSILTYLDDNKDKVRDVRDSIKLAAEVPIRHRAISRQGAVTVLGFAEEEKDGRRVATDRPLDYQVEYVGACEPTLTVTRPYAYLIPPSADRAVETLQRHGIDVEELREDLDLDVEVFQVERVTRLRDFQKHQLLSLDGVAQSQTRRIPAGTMIVRTDQPLGTLATYLLEPQSEDGLATWNFFGSGSQEGSEFPVLQLNAPVVLRTSKARPLPEDRVTNRPVTVEALTNGNLLSLIYGGPSADAYAWLDDGEHYIELKADGHEYVVHAQTGRSRRQAPAIDTDKIAKALAEIPGMDEATAKRLAAQARRGVDPKRTAAFVEHGDDLYYVRLDGSRAVRLTRTPGKKELPSFSPNGKFVAFVQANNLHVVDVETQAERALTTDGTELISNGKADWVYFEEIFNRSWKAYWWSPDSSRIAFLRFDDRPLYKFTVIDQIPTRQVVEQTPYPKAGDPNPIVKLGLATLAGGSVVYPDLGDYSETSSLLIRAGWAPDSSLAYLYIQDRAQTWLDVCTVPPTGGKPARLLRDATKAWIDDPGPLTFLKDGSFLLLSERTGWKHIYHYEKDGKLRRAITGGEWEARQLEKVDEEDGWVYFSGTKDSHTASHSYRVRLDGNDLERITQTAGDHQVGFGPNGRYFIDVWSDRRAQPQVRLHKADGALVRILDSNPVHELDEFKLTEAERVQIRTPDGFDLEASIAKPVDFDPAKKYPVWLTTYGGPHAPTISDSGGRGRGMGDQALTSQGYIVFRVDPRSASGKGAVSTWTAYRQLGVGELQDIETAVKWLIDNHPYVDPARIGMSGHSYGGFLTAYALTHSKLFAAGIAGAPVTDWRNYDSIYTERYMNTPQENPDGYNTTSVVKGAKNLHGKLLILHGVMDDNVHVQNSLQLAYELQRANKDFEMMFYPRARHGIGGAHYTKLMNDFRNRHLLPK
jgi:dipeptidyl aminopeptidase/acylaminoacyl peptidase